jgi:arginine decarboxylase
MAWADDEKCSTPACCPTRQGRVRVYATQSTHKTLTALRQGSMIHVWDQDFKDKAEEAFHEAYMTHTSTSPNYQILASLDVGRRQVELEGYELVQRQLELAMNLRDQVIKAHPLLKVFPLPDGGRSWCRRSFASRTSSRCTTGHRLGRTCCRLARTSLRSTRAAPRCPSDFGNGWRHDQEQVLMDKYDIQINKTSRNTVLFMTNIGTTRSTIAYLIEVLVKIARDVDQRVADMSTLERRIHEKRVRSLTVELPPLPNFSCFHTAFRGRSVDGRSETRDGDIRSAFFLAYDEANCEYLVMDETAKAMKADANASLRSSSSPTRRASRFWCRAR